MSSASRSPMRYPLRHGATCWSFCASAALSQRRRLRALPNTPTPVQVAEARPPPARAALTKPELQASVLPRRPPLKEVGAPRERNGAASPPRPDRWTRGQPQPRLRAAGASIPGRAGQITTSRFPRAPFLPEGPAYRSLTAADAGPTPAVAPLSPPVTPGTYVAPFSGRSPAAAARGPGSCLAARGQGPQP